MEPNQNNKCYVTFEDSADGKTTWRCTKYLMCSGTKFEMHATSCYHYRCPGRRDRPVPIVYEAAPPTTVIVAEPTTVEAALFEKPCANPKCKEKVTAEHKKYCTLKCRKRKNTADIRARKTKNKT